jgi:serine kinase of HPr protein (carbohydrate metabolism regulator)
VIAQVHDGHTALSVLGVSVSVPDDLAGDLASLGPRVQGGATPRVDGTTLPEVLTELTALAVAKSPLLCIHAGVVSSPRGLIVIPAPSGTGKTTLVAALVQAGLGYVSDEVLAIDRRSGSVLAFPRPLALGADVMSILGLRPRHPAASGEQYVSPTELGEVDLDGGLVRDIILIRRERGVAVRLDRASGGLAVAELLRRSFNHYADPAESLRAVVQVVRGSRVWTAEYENAPDLARRIANLDVQRD